MQTREREPNAAGHPKASLLQITIMLTFIQR